MKKKFLLSLGFEPTGIQILDTTKSAFKCVNSSGFPNELMDAFWNSIGTKCAMRSLLERVVMTGYYYLLSEKKKIPLTIKDAFDLQKKCGLKSSSREASAFLSLFESQFIPAYFFSAANNTRGLKFGDLSVSIWLDHETHAVMKDKDCNDLRLDDFDWSRLAFMNLKAGTSGCFIYLHSNVSRVSTVEYFCARESNAEIVWDQINDHLNDPDNLSDGNSPRGCGTMWWVEATAKFNALRTIVKF